MSKRPQHVDVVLDLLRLRVEAETGFDADCGLLADRLFDDTIDWRAVVAFASAHFVLPALGRPLALVGAETGEVPADILAFIEGCESANGARNVRLRDALAGLAETLKAQSIRAVALKGAAFLLDEANAAVPAPWRFMQDLDLLVPESQLLDALAVLEEMGYRAAAEDYDPGREAHYPPLLSPCGSYAIELHTRLFALDAFELPHRSVDGDALPSARLGSLLRVPSPRHRLMHALAHAQLHNRNYARRRLVLKDVLDLALLTRCNRPKQRGLETAALFAEPRSRAAAGALMVACDLALRRVPPASTAKDDRVWAERALGRLAWPAWRRRLISPFDHARLEISRLRTEPGHVARRVRTLTSLQALSRAAEKWRYKQRQYHWH